MSGYDRRLGPCAEHCAVVDECEARGDVIKELRAENERLRLELNEQITSAAQLRELIKQYSEETARLRAARKALGETE